MKEEEIVPSETSVMGPNDFTLNFTTGHPIDGVLRMNSSSDPLARGSVWPTAEAKTTGRYAVKLELSSYRPGKGHLPIVKLLAFMANENGFTRTSTLRELAEIRVRGNLPIPIVLRSICKKETIVVHYDNASLSADQSAEQLAEHLLEIFEPTPSWGRLEYSWLATVRSWLVWWNRIQKIKNQPGFSAKISIPNPDKAKSSLSKYLARTGVNLFETMCCYRFFAGPGLDIHELSVSGLANKAKVDRSDSFGFHFIRCFRHLDTRAVFVD